MPATKIHYVQEIAGPGAFVMATYPVHGEKRSYNLRGNSCDCDGFPARSRVGEVCKHLGLAQRGASTTVGKEVGEKQARKIFEKIKEQLEPAVSNIELVEFSKALSGKISLIKIIGDPNESRATTRILRATVDEVRVEVTLR